MSMSSDLTTNQSNPPSDFVRLMMDQLAKEKGEVQESPWRWTPVSFREFVASPDHMNFPYMTPRQFEAVDALFPSEASKTFDVSNRKFNLDVLLWGKGGGKDSTASICVCYLIHILLCLKRPYEFITGFNIQDATMDIVNVAYNYEQANSVFFTMLKNRIRRWKWLRSYFVLRASGKDLDGKSKSFNPDHDERKVTIYPSAIMFPNMIRVFSAHSMAEGTEGKNIICFIIDEASSLATGTDREKANGDDLFDMLRTSAQSRFSNQWFGFILSFPRHQNDFIMKMYREVLEGKHQRAFASKGATWEIIPSKPYENFKAEFDNPATKRDAETKYACNPPSQQAGFIEFVDRIKDCINPNRKQLAEFETTIKKLPTGAQLIGKIVKKYNIPRQPDSKKFVARVDLGSVHDRCSVCVGHEENRRVVIDLITHWQGRPDCPVDIDEPAELLLKLRKELIGLYYVSYDQWNSLSSLNKLNRAGVVSNKLSLGLEEYKLLRSCIYGKTIDLLDYPLLTDQTTGELSQLQLVDGVKVDHRRGGFNDLSEALCGVTAMLLGVKKNISNVESSAEFYRDTEKDTERSIWSSSEDSVNPNDDMGIMGVSVHLR